MYSTLPFLPNLQRIHRFNNTHTMHPCRAKSYAYSPLRGINYLSMVVSEEFFVLEHNTPKKPRQKIWKNARKKLHKKHKLQKFTEKTSNKIKPKLPSQKKLLKNAEEKRQFSTTFECTHQTSLHTIVEIKKSPAPPNRWMRGHIYTNRKKWRFLPLKNMYMGYFWRFKLSISKELLGVWIY